MAQTLTTFRGKSPPWNKLCTTSSHNWPVPDQRILLNVISSFMHSCCSLSHCPFLDVVISSFALDNEHHTLELYYEALLGIGHNRHIRKSQNSLDSALLSLQLCAVPLSKRRQHRTVIPIFLQNCLMTTTFCITINCLQWGQSLKRYSQGLMP